MGSACTPIQNWKNTRKWDTGEGRNSKACREKWDGAKTSFGRNTTGHVPTGNRSPRLGGHRFLRRRTWWVQRLLRATVRASQWRTPRGGVHFVMGVFPDNYMRCRRWEKVAPTRGGRKHSPEVPNLLHKPPEGRKEGKYYIQHQPQGLKKTTGR
jgi:hypothetical protein